MQEVSTAFKRCRTLGHAWEQIPDTDKQKEPGLARMILRCTSCSTTRRDNVQTNDGMLFNRRYEYPDNYRQPRAKRDEWRLAYMRARGLIK